MAVFTLSDGNKAFYVAHFVANKTMCLTKRFRTTNKNTKEKITRANLRKVSFSFRKSDRMKQIRFQIEMNNNVDEVKCSFEGSLEGREINIA